MGIPIHYSLELPQRCLQLIQSLWPHVEKIHQKEHPELGPLTTTFLLSMAMPIINLPIERMERQREKSGYADDRPLDPDLASQIDKVLGGHAFKKAPFFCADSWSYVKWPSNGFNIGLQIPSEFSNALSSAKAKKDAERMTSSQWSSTLRNALSHGGIAFLDASGRSINEGSAAMYCFVSAQKSTSSDNVHDYLNCLRIREVDFLLFLKEWVAWLEKSGLSKALAAA